jgi:tetratricopeptide (TPR) repeat protein
MKNILFLLSLTVLFIGCNSHKAEEYMKLAKSSIEQHKIPETLKAYETLVSEFPKDSLAPEALYQMGTLYQNRLVPNMKGNETFEKAVTIFKSVFEKYPDSRQARISLFMAGFIQANELNNYQDATATYNLFLQKYPKSDMAAAATEELNNMGLTPEQIIEKKELSNSFIKDDCIKDDCLAAITLNMLMKAEGIANRGDKEALQEYMLSNYPSTIVLKQGGKVKVVDDISKAHFVKVRLPENGNTYWMEKNMLE